jgi:four helix bundle protein
MATYNSCTDFPIWAEAVEFAAELYRFCEKGMVRTDYRMKDQLRAAAASIASNIAEGFEYRDRKNFVRFLLYAKGSAGEVFTQLTILSRAGMISKEEYELFSDRSRRLGRKIGGLIRYLKQAMETEAIRHPSSVIR